MESSLRTSTLTPQNRVTSAAEPVYTQEQKEAALGRHSVKQLNVSNRDLVVTGGVGGAVSAVAAKSLTDCSWEVTAMSSVVGALISVLSRVATARQMTPLEHAKHELAEIREAKDALVATRMDRPDYKCNGCELATIDALAQKYNEKLGVFWVLWAGSYAPAFRNDTKAFMTEFFRVLRDDYNATGNSRASTDRTTDIVTAMCELHSVEQAKRLPAFQSLVEDKNVSDNARDELAELMFTASQIFLNTEDNARGIPLKTAYLDSCRDRFAHYKAHLKQDEANLEHDVLVLEAVSRQQRKVLTTGAPTSGQ